MPKKKFPFGEKILQDLYLLGGNDEFKVDLKKLLEKFSLPPNYEDIDGKKLLEFLQDPKSIDFFKEVIDLVYKYNLQAVFGVLIAFLAEKGHIGEFAAGGKADLNVEEITNVLVERSGIKMTAKTEDYYTLKIYRDTTIKDVGAYWPEIQKSLSHKNKRSNVSKNIGRDLEILRLKNLGKTAKDIAKAINDDPKFKNKKRIYYQDIPVIIKRLKDKAKGITD